LAAPFLFCRPVLQNERDSEIVETKRLGRQQRGSDISLIQRIV
jgi:hypothetical protein